MTHLDFKKQLKTAVAMASLFLTRPVFADPPEVNPDNPTPLVVITVIKKVFNVFILSAGVFLVAMILTSAYKFATSQGDPKALAGAKQSLMYGIIGFFVVISTYLILNIITGVFGADANYGAPGIFGTFGQAFQELLNLGDVTGIGDASQY